MTKEELKNKCTERAKIFQQAMKSCKSSNPMELIEWFADRIADLEKENREQKKLIEWLDMAINSDIPIADKLEELEKENAELKELEKENAEPKEANAQWEQRNVTLKDALENARKIYGDDLEKAYKENAELKVKLENLQKYLDTQNCYLECAETWMKLTEAKKLLKQFLEAKNGEDIYKAEWEAEQFLRLACF